MASEVSTLAPWKDHTGSEAGSASNPLAYTDAVAALVLKPLASLKLTVALFSMGIFIVLVGTLAQVDKDMWQVIDEYFRSLVVAVEFQVFFPRSWFPKWQSVPFGFWFPGGATIGALMVVNLLAAHLVRFKSQATNGRLIAGSLIILAGAALTAFVIATGHNREGLQGEPPFSWETLWRMVRGGLAFGSASSLYAAWAMRGRRGPRKLESGLMGGLGLILGATLIWTMIAGENAYLGDSGMRILWQLIVATFCGLVLLLGCVLVFRKRGGIVLIHAGVGLMMFGQFYVSKYDVEEQMRIEEGQTRSYAEDVRQTELAIVDSTAQQDQVVVIPRSVLLASVHHNRSFFSSRPEVVDEKGIIRHPDLPFDVQVLTYYRNADVRKPAEGEKNVATAGLGREVIAVEAKPAAGADSDARVDLAAAYVRCLKRDGSDLGTYLLTQFASFQGVDEQVEVDGKTYDVSLRFQRNYKPYQVQLLDVRKDDYVGTSTPRNYSSDIRLVDSTRGVDREIHIWMNNPLRYAGETFYQSGYIGPPDAETEATTLSIVTNSGWLIPYVSCMIVIVGLAAHFLGTLTRFLRKPEAAASRERASQAGRAVGLGTVASLLRQQFRPEDRSAEPPKRSRGAGKDKDKDKGSADDTFRPSLEPVRLRQALAVALSWAFPWLVVAPLAIWLVSSMLPASTDPDEMNIHEFGRLPVIAEGRVKPFDTLARNTLLVIADRQSFKDDDQQRQPAIRWLLDVIAQREEAEKHRVMRIDNLEVLDTLGLERRKGYLYSIEEIRGGVEAFEKQVDQAQKDAKEKGAENLTVYQRKLLDLDRRIRTYTRVAAAFQPPALPPLPTQEEFQQDRAGAERKLIEFRDEYVRFVRSIDGIQPPLSVPLKPTQENPHQLSAGEEWQPYSKAVAMATIDSRLLGNPIPPALQALNEIFVAYANQDAATFNKKVQDYRELLARERPSQLVATNTFWNRTVERWFGNFYRFEEFFNRVSPFHFAQFPYVFAAVFAALSWLVWSVPLRRTAWWLAAFCFAVHTLALGARIYISGRPPVTNLYSSAVFIGWGVVLFCLIWEWLNRNGLPTFIGSLLGFSSLIIAHYLSLDGDTFTVLQAVLDTQFWLATHVVCITLGYATTFLAGGIGLLYVLRGLFTPTLTNSASKEMARMIYGTTCFALFFSFFGTVLGGLWADDSWGRFWGWDPKENGALIIVMWNALVLHARWDGMVKDRGMAVLSIGGNIVTAWSWFGVNELGVGLHSYGFTEGVLLALGVFVGSQLLVIVGGCLPKNVWWSFMRHGKPTSEGDLRTAG